MDYLAKVNHSYNELGCQAVGWGQKGQTCWQRVVVFCATVAVNNRRETMVLPIHGDTKLCPMFPYFPLWVLLSMYMAHMWHATTALPLAQSFSYFVTSVATHTHME